ncbi:MAG: PD-(D/E)XK nuclease family protein, partial [Planctomycetes bacterium]|nr:PD-(D/E)XK nuclease family protein [Planctomycetota bacterium]
PVHEIPDALRHAFPSEPAPQAPPGEDATTERVLPRLSQTPELTRMSVMDFKAYLDSRYLFYVERFLKLESVTDRDRELDPRRFGTLVHDVLESFGRGDLRNSTDAEAITTELQGLLNARVHAWFGSAVIPSVHLQIEGVRRRLAWFAEKQAARAAEGWRIEHVEWQSEEPVRFGPPGAEVELIGKIDRIDVHPTLGLAVLDYKTGDKAKSPNADHRKKDETWTNLQLPLYDLLVRGLAGERSVQLGYFHIGKDPDSVGVYLATWDQDDLESAHDAGRQVVADIRAGRFAHRAKRRIQDPILMALVGDNLVGETSEGEFDGVGVEQEGE